MVSGLLITKNNGKTLEWALSSVYKYLDELVIIDDFSTDNTVEIARKYNAKIPSREILALANAVESGYLRWMQMKLWVKI